MYPFIKKNIYLIILSLVTMEYVKQISGRFKDGKREEGLKIIAELWNENVGKVKGLTAFVLMANLYDSQGATNSTAWETKEDMDKFYQPDNKAISDLVERLKPSLEQLPVRKEYRVAKFKV